MTGRRPDTPVESARRAYDLLRRVLDQLENYCANPTSSEDNASATQARLPLIEQTREDLEIVREPMAAQAAHPDPDVIAAIERGEHTASVVISLTHAGDQTTVNELMVEMQHCLTLARQG